MPRDRDIECKCRTLTKTEHPRALPKTEEQGRKPHSEGGLASVDRVLRVAQHMGKAELVGLCAAQQSAT